VTAGLIFQLPVILIYFALGEFEGTQILHYSDFEHRVAI